MSKSIQHKPKYFKECNVLLHHYEEQKILVDY